MLEKVAVFIFGGCVGSFLNVCIYRLPRDLSIVMPPSFCPHCKTPISWFDNIPILSYLVLRGRSRCCRKRISIRYPLVELITAVLFVFLFIYLGSFFSLVFLKYAFLFSFLVVVSVIDIDYHAIPAYLCFLGIIVGLGFSVYETIVAFRHGYVENLAIVAAFKNLLFALGFAYFFKLLGDVGLGAYLSLRRKDSIEGEREALGLGDVDFLGLVGVFLGFKAAVLTFFIAPFIALFYTIFALLFKRSHLIPYLPYLSVAAFIAFLWGNDILFFLGWTVL